MEDWSGGALEDWSDEVLERWIRLRFGRTWGSIQLRPRKALRKTVNC